MTRFLVLLLLSLTCCVTLPACSNGGTPKNAAPTWKDPLTGIEFVWVEGGCFEMGMNPEDAAWIREEVGERFFKQKFMDEPRREACPEGFWFARTEVTRAQWEAITDQETKNCDTPGGQDAPVGFIAQFEAADAARALTDKHDGAERFALPTEAQWERACMRNEPDHLGIQKLHNGTSEWTSDFYTPDGVPPVIEERTAMRVIKGASARQKKRYQRCANRRGAVPGYVNCDVGVRFVRLAPAPQ